MFAALIIFLLLGGLWRAHYAPKSVAGEKITQESAVELIFLSIGQGDATLIFFPNGEKMLVDCGPDSGVLAAMADFLPFYDHKLDYLMITHPDSDHYGGCADVLKRFDVGYFIDSAVEKTEPGYVAVLEEARKENAVEISLSTSSSLDIAGAKIDFLEPFSFQKEWDNNNNSVVFVLRYGDSSALFVGDAETEREDFLLEKYGSDLDVGLLKVGHHGSAGASSEVFLEKITPKEAVISVGDGNKYGHPSLRVVRKLERSGARVWRTDTRGDIIFRMTRDKILVEENL